VIKLREFWIDIPDVDWSNAYLAFNKPSGVNQRDGFTTIHVIEYSAFEKLRAKCERYREALETLKVAVNDKVNDPGATAFIERVLKETRGEEPKDQDQ
jgi:hypothetical protein